MADDSNEHESDPHEEPSLLDVVVFGPIDAAFALLRDPRGSAVRGRARVDQALRQARGVTWRNGRAHRDYKAGLRSCEDAILPEEDTLHLAVEADHDDDEIARVREHLGEGGYVAFAYALTVVEGRARIDLALGIGQ